MLKLFTLDMCLKMINLSQQRHLPVVIELIPGGYVCQYIPWIPTYQVRDNMTAHAHR